MMDNELELALKQIIEELQVVDNVILDFQEKLEGESAIIVSIDKINRIQPYMNKQGNLIEYQATLFGIFKTNDNISETIEKRNNALKKLLTTFLNARIGNSQTKIETCEKRIWRDKTNDTLYYFTFEMTIAIQKIVR